VLQLTTFLYVTSAIGANMVEKNATSSEPAAVVNDAGIKKLDEALKKIDKSSEAADAVRAIYKLHVAAEKGDQEARAKIKGLGLEGSKDLFKALVDVMDGDSQAHQAGLKVLSKALGIEGSKSVTTTQSAALLVPNVPMMPSPLRR
jgi:predicted metalloprotease with PDZ domain